MNPMMSALRTHRAKLPLLALVLAAPWAWSIFFVPPWVGIVCLLLMLPTGAILLLHVLPPSHAPRRATDDARISDEEIMQMRRHDAEQRDRMHQTIFSLHMHVSRWSDASEHSQGDLRLVQREVAQVIGQIASAVTSIGNSFSAIMRKTATQMDRAVRLLKSEEEPQDGDKAGKWISLPDYIRAYESQLNSVTERMMQVSSASRLFDEHQHKMREHTVLVDELLDELRAMAKQTGKLALESSMIASGGNTNHQDVVTLTDTIRSISEQTHELTRRIRRSLDSIREQISESHKAMRAASAIAERAATQAKVEVAQLNVTMMDKTHDVKDALEHISKLGTEIQAEISSIIIAMQFQDITQQKLERVHQPVLGRVIGDLRSIADESIKMKGEMGHWLKASPQREGVPFKLVRGGARTPVNVLKEPAAEAADEDSANESAASGDESRRIAANGPGSVELF